MGKTVWLALIRPTPVQTAAIHGQRERARAAIASIDRSYPEAASTGTADAVNHQPAAVGGLDRPTGRANTCAQEVSS